ncbi:MAG: bile acid:sodium symporter family protein, partial [Bacteroidota bacterium]
GEIASYLILILLFTIIFASYFQADITIPGKKKLINDLLFSLLRYVLIPVIVFLVIKEINVFFSYALLFLFMMPSGVSSPAITQILGGNFNLSIRILILSSFIVTFFLPSISPVLDNNGLQISYNKLFFTLLFTIILPFFLHLPARKIRPVKRWMTRNLSLTVVTCLSIIFMLAIAKNKQGIIEHPSILPMYFVVSLTVYMVLYSSGYFLLPRETRQNKITLSVSSGLNNVGLGLSLSILYLPPDITIFFIVSEIVWVSMIIPVKIIFRRSMVNDLSYGTKNNFK